MAGEIVQPESVAVMSFNRPLLVPVAHHAYIKAAMAMTAQEIFPEPTFDPSSVTFATLDKIGPRWKTMDVVVPDKLPAGVFDRLPEGTQIRLAGDGRGNELLITRASDEDFPLYTARSQNSKLSPRAAREPYPDLTEQDVITLMLSGLGIGAFGREINDVDDARNVLHDLALANPKCERVCMDGRRERWEVGGALGSMAASAALIRVHRDSMRWKRPRESYRFIGTTTLPLELPMVESGYADSHACTADRKVTYSFKELYGVNEADIEADMEVEFASANPLTDTARQQYARIFRESGPSKQDSLAQDIARGLGNLSMAYRDEQSR